MQAFRLVLAATLVVGLGACAAPKDFSLNPMDWWGAKKGPKPAELQPLANALPVRILWQAGVGAGGAAAFSPAVVDSSVYAAAADGSVSALDSASGKLLWRVNVERQLSGGVGAGGGLVVVGSPEGEVIALEAGTGALRWRARVSSEVLAPPVIAEDLVMVRAVDSRLFALDARDGRRRWVYQRTAPSLAVRSPVGMASGRGQVYAGFAGGKLAAVSLSNGAVRWEGTVALPKGATELERVTDVVGLPQITEREACAVAYQGRVACFDIANGNSLWSRVMSSTSGLALDARYVFVTDDRDAVHGLDRAGGTSVWRSDQFARRGLTAPLALGQEVLVADMQGFVHFLSRDTGQAVARISTDGSPIVSAPVRLGTAALLQTLNGTIYAITINR